MANEASLKVQKVGHQWLVKGHTKPYTQLLLDAGANWNGKMICWVYDGDVLPQVIKDAIAGVNRLDESPAAQEETAHKPILVLDARSAKGEPEALRQQADAIAAELGYSLVGTIPLDGSEIAVNPALEALGITAEAVRTIMHVADKLHSTSPVGEPLAENKPKSETEQWGDDVRAAEAVAREALAQDDPDALDKVVEAVEVGHQRPKDAQEGDWVQHSIQWEIKGRITEISHSIFITEPNGKIWSCPIEQRTQLKSLPFVTDRVPQIGDWVQHRTYNDIWGEVETIGTAKHLTVYCLYWPGKKADQEIKCQAEHLMIIDAPKEMHPIMEKVLGVKPSSPFRKPDTSAPTGATKFAVDQPVEYTDWVYDREKHEAGWKQVPAIIVKLGPKRVKIRFNSASEGKVIERFVEPTNLRPCEETEAHKALKPEPEQKPAFKKQSNTTPLRQQYLDLKKNYPNTILLMQLGDFYEAFDEDAETIARELDLVLTSRPISTKERIPMAGFPVHAAETYIRRLIEKRISVAVADQIKEPDGTGLVERKITREEKPADEPEPQIKHGDLVKQHEYGLGIFYDQDASGKARVMLGNNKVSLPIIQLAPVSGVDDTLTIYQRNILATLYRYLVPNWKVANGPGQVGSKRDIIFLCEKGYLKVVAVLEADDSYRLTPDGCKAIGQKAPERLLMAIEEEEAKIAQTHDLKIGDVVTVIGSDVEGTIIDMDNPRYEGKVCVRRPNLKGGSQMTHWVKCDKVRFVREAAVPPDEQEDSAVLEEISLAPAPGNKLHAKIVALLKAKGIAPDRIRATMAPDVWRLYYSGKLLSGPEQPKLVGAFSETPFTILHIDLNYIKVKIPDEFFSEPTPEPEKNITLVSCLCGWSGTFDDSTEATLALGVHLINCGKEASPPAPPTVQAEDEIRLAPAMQAEIVKAELVKVLRTFEQDFGKRITLTIVAATGQIVIAEYTEMLDISATASINAIVTFNAQRDTLTLQTSIYALMSAAESVSDDVVKLTYNGRGLLVDARSTNGVHTVWCKELVEAVP